MKRLRDKKLIIPTILLIVILVILVIITIIQVRLEAKKEEETKNQEKEWTESELLNELNAIDWEENIIELVYRLGEYVPKEDNLEEEEVSYTYTYRVSYDIEEETYTLKFTDLNIDGLNKNTFQVYKPSKEETYFSISGDMGYYLREEEIPQSIYFEEEVELSKILSMYMEDALFGEDKLEVTQKEGVLKKLNVLRETETGEVLEYTLTVKERG